MALFGLHQPSTPIGLTLGLYGGRWNGNTIGAAYGDTDTLHVTLALTDATTNYVVANRSTGALSTSTATTNWDDTDTYGRVRKVVTAAGAMTDHEDFRLQPGGIFDFSAAVVAGVSSVNGESGAVTLDAADVGAVPSSYLDTDVTLAADSDAKVSTQKAVKAYVDDAVSSAGGGDASTNTSVSVDSEVALFSGTTGKLLKRATGSGFAKLLSGVLSTVTPNSGDISDFTEAVQDVIGAMVAAAGGSYNDGAGTIALPLQCIPIACSDETTALTAGTGKVTFRMPYAFTVTAVRASLTTAQTSGSIFTVDINEGGTSILSTKLTIDNTEKTSTTAATAAVISDTALADDAEITIDIDQIGDGTAKGLKVYLIGRPA
jgi:hypothetical protein